ncbi:hypothetical protein [Neosynechococcus sphagnicola]|nr:hypothetical protein [Neosynechococcus sphagnicola]
MVLPSAIIADGVAARPWRQGAYSGVVGSNSGAVEQRASQLRSYPEV